MARLAAVRRTPEDLVALDQALDARTTAWRAGDAATFIEVDVVFHQSVVAAAHNRILAELYADFSTALRSSLTDSIGTDLAPERWVDHGRLVEAIRAGDPDRAAHEAGAYLEAPAAE